MVAAYAFWALRTGYFDFTLATVPAAIAAIVVVACSSACLSELLVFRPLRTSSPLAKLVASLGILLVLQATMLLWFGSAAQADPERLPDAASSMCSASRSRRTGSGWPASWC